MKRYLRDSMIIFGIVLVALFVFLQTAFGARGLYSSQNLDYDKGYYYESDDFSLYTYSDSYDNTSKSDLISLYDTAQPIFTNVANNYYMNVCEFDSEDDSVCKEHYNQEANGNVPFNDASIFRTVDDDGDICIYINSYQIKEETTPEIFVRTVVNSISDQALDYYISEPTLTDYYNNNKETFASVYGEEHVTDLNHFLREGLVRYCISRDDFKNNFSGYYQFLQNYVFTTKDSQTVLRKNNPYRNIFTNLDTDDRDDTSEETTSDGEDTSQESENTPSIVGYWKYEQFPDVASSDACTYTRFNEDGTFESYTNPGPQFAQHCVNKESGTYSVNGNTLVLNVNGQTNWTYTYEWIDENHFDRTYVTHVDSYERVSDQEFMSYYA